MPTLPRILAIVGSGETAPPLAKIHRSIFDRLGPPPVPAVLLDTPYGFQENADDISARAVEYFRDSVGRPITVVTFRSAAEGTLAEDTAVARIRAAHLVFSGPGSPTYALRQWAGTGIPRALAARLAEGGAVVFASAASLTLGAVTAPIYEAYKAGIEPHWLPGLDLLGPFELPVAVIPHYDNAEGGTHDTRYCYLGERRLSALERELPDGVFVLGVDGHTAVIFDLDSGQVSVTGSGGLTVRIAGRSAAFPSGSALSIAEIREAARRLASGVEAGAGPDRPGADPRSSEGPGGSATAPSSAGPGGAGLSPYLAEVARLEARFDACFAGRDVPGAAEAALELERTIHDWSRDTTQTDDVDHARAALRSMIVRLGDAAASGARDPAEAISPFVEALLELREAARGARDFAASDRVRDRLEAAGIEVRDTPSGPEWEVRRP